MKGKQHNIGVRSQPKTTHHELLPKSMVTTSLDVTMGFSWHCIMWLRVNTFRKRAGTRVGIGTSKRNHLSSPGLGIDTPLSWDVLTVGNQSQVGELARGVL